MTFDVNIYYYDDSYVCHPYAIQVWLGEKLFSIFTGEERNKITTEYKEFLKWIEAEIDEEEEINIRYHVHEKKTNRLRR